MTETDVKVWPEREYSIVAWVAVVLVVLRSLVLVFWEQAHFDSDQAISGLMAKHLSELRAFPVFFYGQSHILAVEAWLAVPLFLVAGVSVATLKLPLLAVNIAIAVLLLRTFTRETGLRPALALLPTLCFVLPAPGTAARFLDVSGGNIESSLYIILIWLTRARPAVGGVLLGIGFLQREFTIYGFAALLLIEALQGSLFTRAGIRLRLSMLRVAAEVWLVVQWLKLYSSAAGPGTSFFDVPRPKDNLVVLINRLCFDMGALMAGIKGIFTEHWPALFGTRVIPLSEFGIESRVIQGLPWGFIFPVGAMLLAIAGIAMRLSRDRRILPEFAFCLYLTLAAGLSVAGYVGGHCGDVSYGFMRYDLISVLGAVGIGAWFLRSDPPRLMVQAWAILLAGWIGIAAVAQARLLTEYLTQPPVGLKQVVVRDLEAKGIRFAVSDYWISYAVTFMANERVIVASGDRVRIQEYVRLVEEQPPGAVLRISRTPCLERTVVAPGLYLCPK